MKLLALLILLATNVYADDTYTRYGDTVYDNKGNTWTTYGDRTYKTHAPEPLRTTPTPYSQPMNTFGNKDHHEKRGLFDNNYR